MDQRLSPAAPLVSVVMCTYNARSFIEEAVDCILNQTYQHWELVISDDCSTDGTREWLQELKDARIRLFLQEKNLGYVANKNFVHQQALGTYITQLDNDDLCSYDKLAKQMAIVEQNPEIKMVACGYYRIDNTGHRYSRVEGERDRLIEAPEKEYPFWFPALLVHREVFEKVGFFDSYFAGVFGDDLYWTVKANQSFPIYFLQEPLYSYRYNPNSITNVLNNHRKLIFGQVLRTLLQQRKASGTDWLEKQDYTALQDLENKLLQDKKFMAEQYRTWAAKAVDKGEMGQARKLLLETFNTFPWRKDNFSTLFYFLRASFK